MHASAQSQRLDPLAMTARLHSVNRLAGEIRKLETAGRAAARSDVISTGCEALDACLPQGGYVPGCVIEYLRSSAACGASYLAFSAAAAAMHSTQGYVVVVDTRYAGIGQLGGESAYGIYPPALAAQDIPLPRVIFVRPRNMADALWAVDQSLRTPAVAAVVAELDCIDERSARRLQLAAETGGTLALLLRDMAARRGPSWAEVQWLVQAVPYSYAVDQTAASLRTQPSTRDPLLSAARRIVVQLVRNRSGQAGVQVELEIDLRTGGLRGPSNSPLQPSERNERNRHEHSATVHLASQLASPKNPSRRAAAS